MTNLLNKIREILEHPLVNIIANTIKKFKSSKSYWSISSIILLFSMRELIAWKYGMVIKNIMDNQAENSSFPLLWEAIGFIFDIGGSIELVIFGIFIFLILSFVKIFESKKQSDTTKYRIPNTEDKDNYYIYISDSKLKMFYHIDKEPSFNKYLCLNQFKQDINNNYLQKEGYIKNSLYFQWGIVDFGVQDADYRMVFFFNNDEKLLLTGSVKHIISENYVEYKHPNSYFGYSGSSLPNVIQMLKLEMNQTFKNYNNEENILKVIRKYIIHFPTQKLSFVAKVLKKSDNLMIASPIYVSLLPNESHIEKKILLHRKIDPIAIEKEQKKKLKKEEEKRKTQKLDILYADFTLDSFIEYCKIAHPTDSWLDNQEVLKYCAYNFEKTPFSWKYIFEFAQKNNNKEIQIIVLEKGLELDKNLDALLYVGKYKFMELHNIVISKLSNNNPNIRKLAIHVLGELNCIKDLNTLNKLLETESNENVKKEIIKVIDKLTKI